MKPELKIKVGLRGDSDAMIFKSLYEADIGFVGRKDRWFRKGGHLFREVLEAYVVHRTGRTTLKFRPGEVIFDWGPQPIEPPEA